MCYLWDTVIFTISATEMKEHVFPFVFEQHSIFSSDVVLNFFSLKEKNSKREEEHWSNGEQALNVGKLVWENVFVGNITFVMTQISWHKHEGTEEFSCTFHIFS